VVDTFDVFSKYSGFNEWAMANRFVVVYPKMGTRGNISQMHSGCWDGYGDTGPSYALRSGPQMKAVAAMIHGLGGPDFLPVVEVPLKMDDAASPHLDDEAKLPTITSRTDPATHDADGGRASRLQLQLQPCGSTANATGRQNWTIGDGNNQGPISLAGAALFIAVEPRQTASQPRLVLTRNRSAALNFEFLPMGRGQRGAEAWIRTTGLPAGPRQPGGLCMDDTFSAPHHPRGLPPGGIFLGGCQSMEGGETWVRSSGHVPLNGLDVLTPAFWWVGGLGSRALVNQARPALACEWQYGR
jgi:hypothetical protein